MQCLNCGIEMMNYDVATRQPHISYKMMNYHVSKQQVRTSYNACEKCGSLWLDAGEFDKMAFQVAGDIEYCSQELAEGAEKDVKKCPRCEDSDLNPVKFLESD